MNARLAIGCVFSVIMVVLAAIGFVHLVLDYFGWVTG